MRMSMETALLIVNAAVGIAILVFLLLRRSGDAGAGAGAAATAEALAAAHAAEAEATRKAVQQFELRLGESIARGERTTRETLESQLSAAREQQARASQELRTELDAKLGTNQQATIARLDAMRTLTEQKLAESRESTQQALDRAREATSAALEKSREAMQQSLDKVRETTQLQLTTLRDENQKKLDEMRGVVDKQLNETLQTRIGQAFETVSKQLEQVHQQLGQVQSLATGVSDLRKTLEGVKTRGVFGEVMLQGLLEEFLHPGQFELNFRPKPRSNETVEFAIKLPNKDEAGNDDPVYLPIDAKFPKESYERLLACLERGDLSGAETERKQLLAAVLGFARDIQGKYVSPPRTTEFAILYLPLESLFAEVVREPGFIERLQQDCRVTLCSPTTLAAYLNALKMGFRTLAVQKQSAEIGKLLSVVRKQFQMFGDDLAKVEKRLDESRNALAATVKRTQIMDGKLRSIEAAGEGEVQRLLPPGAEAEFVDVEEA